MIGLYDYCFLRCPKRVKNVYMIEFKNISYVRLKTDNENAMITRKVVKIICCMGVIIIKNE